MTNSDQRHDRIPSMPCMLKLAVRIKGCHYSRESSWDAEGQGDDHAYLSILGQASALSCGLKDGVLRAGGIGWGYRKGIAAGSGWTLNGRRDLGRCSGLACSAGVQRHAAVSCHSRQNEVNRGTDVSSRVQDTLICSIKEVANRVRFCMISSDGQGSVAMLMYVRQQIA